VLSKPSTRQVENPKSLNQISTDIIRNGRQVDRQLDAIISHLRRLIRKIFDADREKNLFRYGTLPIWRFSESKNYFLGVTTTYYMSVYRRRYRAFQAVVYN
jgi:hypothetical protein